MKPGEKTMMSSGLAHLRSWCRQARYYSRMCGQWLARDSKSCPYCNSTAVTVLCRKRFFVRRMLCERCRLEYRHPKDRETFSSNFRSPRAPCDISQRELQAFLDSNFVGSRYDFSADIQIVRRLVPLGRVLVYGASFGSAVHQLRAAGYETIGFEIDQARVEYGRRHLGVEICADLQALESMACHFDVIHATHVLEHITDIGRILRLFGSIIRPQGLLYVRVPNCTRTASTDLDGTWGTHLGDSHVLALTKEFFLRNLPAHGFTPSVHACDGGRYDLDLIVSTAGRLYVDESEGGELLIVATHSGTSKGQLEGLSG